MRLRPGTQGIHWQAPTIIILTFTAGLAFAIAHHAFYSSLDNVPLDDNVFNQQWNIAIGTALAFLVRACLVIATCTAYWQVFWETALRKDFPISSVDALTGVLGSLIDYLASARDLFFNPILAALALLAWLVPLASLLPPATLSVISASTSNSTISNVLVPNFDHVFMVTSTYRILAGDRFIPSSVIDVYMKPSLRLQRLATTTAYRGAFPEHQTLYANSSYKLDFRAPALQCKPLSQEIMLPFNDITNCDFTGSSYFWNTSAEAWETEKPCDVGVPFISWVPEHLDAVPFDNGTIREGLLPLTPELEGTGSLNARTNYDKRYVGGYEGGPSSIFVASRSQDHPWYTGDWDVLNCSLFNATYDVQISSDSNRRSTPYLSGVDILDSIPFDEEMPLREKDTPAPANDSAVFGYYGLMESFNRLLVGSVATRSIGPDIYSLESLTRFQNPHLMGTLLAFTRELQVLLARTRNKNNQAPPDESQWTLVDRLNESLTFLPNEALSASTANKSLGPVLEELFQNMTLALFSDEYFLKESDEPVNITLSHTRNVYSYSKRNLLMSYGIALGLTLLACIAGCVAIIFNGASYTHKFSTILRTTSGLEPLVAKSDRTGADPLPKYLSRTKINLGRGVEDAQEGRQQAPETTSERSAMIEHGGDASKSPGAVSQRCVSPER